MNNLENKPTALSPGEQKIAEYVNRINSGEDASAVMEGLPESFRNGIERRINKNKTQDSRSEAKTDIVIPPQYENLDPEIVDMLWIIPEYADPEKTKSEKLRKETALATIKQQQNKKEHTEEVRTQDLEQAEQIKQELEISQAVIPEAQTDNKFSEFSVKNGESDGGYYWYEYRNAAAKELKNSGQFKWGTERIYFDTKLQDSEKLRDIIFKIAAQNNIPIGFKYLDTNKTFQANIDGNETRFVTNFASLEDTQKFYALLSKSEEYKSLISDREMDYKGVRLDDAAEYASGYREQREAMERAANATLQPSGQYAFRSESGKLINISVEEYQNFKNTYDELSEKLQNVEKTWRNVLGKDKSNPGDNQDSNPQFFDQNAKQIRDTFDMFNKSIEENLAGTANEKARQMAEEIRQEIANGKNSDEAKEKVLEGLGPVFRRSVEKELAELSKQDKSESEEEVRSPDIKRLLETIGKYNIELPNLNELLANDIATLEVVANGEKVKFDKLVVTIDKKPETDGSEIIPGWAEVGFIEKSNRDEHKGIGVPLYVTLGKELLKNNIVLRSSDIQYGPGANIWQKLASLGYAKKTGRTYQFTDK